MSLPAQPEPEAQAPPHRVELTTAQKARIERNRAKALGLRQAKLLTLHSYAITKKDTNAPAAAKEDASIIKVQGTKYIDSGGGFLLEQPVLPGTSSSSGGAATGDSAANTGKPPAVVVDDAIAIPISYEECNDCGEPFADSFLFDNFALSVCDKCRNSDERHALITRTEAKAEYLLKDCDFDRREPPLRYISRKNPHNVRWGEMKLYLHQQVVQRAMEVWGSEEELVAAHENRVEKQDVSKVRKYNKKMKQLRMEVRSSLYKKETKATHAHDFGPDTYNEEEDNYTHTCTTCSYSETYEKM